MFQRCFRYMSVLYFFLGIFSGHIFMMLRSHLDSSSGSTEACEVNLSICMHPNSSRILPFSSKSWTEVEDEGGLGWSGLRKNPVEPKVYVVTPTYRRPQQYAELTRIYQALYPARHFVVWLIVDELKSGSRRHMASLHRFLHGFNITKRLFRSKHRPAGVHVFGNPRGVDSRRRAISFLRRKQREGLVLFADDDNTYDSELFGQIQTTKGLSAWPVGCLTQVALGSPVVEAETGKVIDFHDGWVGNRKFPLDFAGFAFNISYLHKYPEGNIPWIVAYEETGLLSSLRLTPGIIEALGDNSSRVMAYHTRTLPLTLSQFRNTSLTNKLNGAVERLDSTNLFPLWASVFERS